MTQKMEALSCATATPGTLNLDQRLNFSEGRPCENPPELSRALNRDGVPRAQHRSCASVTVPDHCLARAHHHPLQIGEVLT